MRRGGTLLLTMLALPVIVAVPVSAQSPTRYYTCFTNDFSKHTSYVSPIFSSTADPQTVSKEWGALMTSKYGITAINYYPCSQGGFTSPEQAKGLRDSYVERFRDRMKQQVVDVDWTYGGAQAVAVASAPPQAQAAPPPPAKPTELTAAQRAQAQAQVTASAGWCQYNMHELRTLFGCNNFAQAVLKHQLEHPEEWRADRDHPRPEPPNAHDLAGGIPYHLNCAACLTDQGIAAYIDQILHETNSPNEAKIKQTEACLVPTFGKLIRAEPYPDAAQRLYNTANAQCAGSKP